MSFKNSFFCLCIFLLAILAVYGKTVQAPFHFDDLSFILDNPRVTDLHQMFGALGDDTRKFFSLLTFAVNYHFNGGDPFWYHVVNIIFHFMAAIFLWRALLWLFQAPWFKRVRLRYEPHSFSAWVTLIFLLHPLQTQSVTYIWERSEVLSGLFYALILWCYWKGRIQVNRRFIIYSACFFFLGLFVKGTVLTAPLLIGLSELMFFDGMTVFKRLNWTAYVRIIYIGIILFLTAHVASHYVFEKGLGIHPRYLFTQFPILWKYLSLTILPLGQSVEHAFRGCKDLTDPYFVLSGLALVGLFAGLCALARPLRLAAFGAFWYFIYLIPTSSVFSIGTPIFEHRLYFSIPGFGICVMACLFRVFDGSRIFWRNGLACLLIFSLGLTAFFRNDVWMSREALMKDAIFKNPGLSRPYFTLGSYYLSENRLDDAQEMFRQAIHLAPTYAEAHNNLGVVFMRRREMDEALKEFHASIYYKPLYVNAYLNMAELFQRIGDIPAAWGYIVQGMTLSNDERLFAMAVRLLLRMGDSRRAEKFLNDGLRIHPRSARLYYVQGGIFFRKENLKRAIRSYEKAVNLDPNYRDAFNDMGVAFFRLGEFDKARQVLERAKELNPRLPGVYVNLANVYHELGEYATAERYFELSRTVQFRSNASMHLK